MPANTYYLWGEENYLIDREIARIIEASAASGLDEPEVLRVDTDQMSAMDLGQTLEFSPLFALRRVVIIKDPVWLGKSTRKSRKISESLQVLEDYFLRDHPGQVLIITSSEYNASNPVLKLLVKKAQVLNLKPLTPVELGKWCQGELDRLGLEMVPAALQRMVNSGQDMYYLQNLMAKLSLLAWKEPLELKVIEEQLDLRQEVKVFKLTDALMNRNLKVALAAFYQLREQGEPHLLLLHMISRQYFSLAKIKFYQMAGYSQASLAKETGLKDFMIRKLADKSSQFSPEEIRSIFAKLLDVDRSLKSEGKDPDLLMEALLIEICSPK